MRTIHVVVCALPLLHPRGFNSGIFGIGGMSLDCSSRMTTPSFV